MKEIVLTFKTKKGERAYRAVEAEGKAQPFMERKIAKSVAKDVVVSNSPLTIKIHIKIKRLAVKIELDKQIVTALEKFGAVLGKDYDMQVVF